MASTYSPSLKLTLIGDGDQSSIWGQTTNTNLGTLLDQAIAGVVSITMSDANYTLSSLNGTADEARNAVIVVGGSNAAIRDVIPPVIKKLYTVVNNTSGGFAIRVIGATGTGVNIPNGATALVFCNGTNFVSGLSGSSGNFSIAGALTATTINGTTITAATQFTGPGTGLTGTAAGLTVGSATTATTATTATSAAAITNSGGWSVTPSGTKLYFNYNGTNVASIDSSGNFTTIANVTAYGTP